MMESPTSVNDSGREKGLRIVEGVLGRPVSGKQEFISDLSRAISGGGGYVAGRIGISEKHWLDYPIIKEKGMHDTQMRVFESRMRYQAETQVGIFPGTPDFLLEYNHFYADCANELGYLGLVFDTVLDPEIARHFNWRQPLVYYKDLEPDMSSPFNSAGCYLEQFKGKRVLLICPFADLLAERVNRETFDRVWSNTGRAWFEPESVQALTCPHGIAKETQERCASAMEIYDDLTGKMRAMDFDVALVAVGGAVDSSGRLRKRIWKRGHPLWRQTAGALRCHLSPLEGAAVVA